MAIDIATPASSHSANPANGTGAHDAASTGDERRAVAILTLLEELQAHRYDHLCPTPETQRFALAKRQKIAGNGVLYAKSLQDVWGWSLPVHKTVYVQIS